MWGLLDQAVVSLGSFLTIIVLARTMDLPAYGTLAVILAAMVFLNNLVAALIGYPLIVRGAVIDEGSFRNLALTALMLSAVIASVLGVLFVCIVGWGYGDIRLGLVVGTALALGQLQQMTRSAFMARSQYRRAIPGDAARYLGQAAIIWLLGIRAEAHVFAVMAIVALGALALQAWTLGLFGALPQSLAMVSLDFWTLGKWAVLTALVGGLTLQVFVVGLAWSHGNAEIAKYQAMINVLGVSHPIIMSLGNIIVPAVAVATVTGTVRDGRRIAFRRAMPFAVLLAPYLLFLVWAPAYALNAFYGAQSPYVDLTVALRWFVLAYIFVFIASVLGSLLEGSERPRHRLIAQIGSVCGAIIIGFPLVVRFGVEGGSAGFAVSTIIGAIIAAYIVNSSLEVVA